MVVQKTTVSGDRVLYGIVVHIPIHYLVTEQRLVECVRLLHILPGQGGGDHFFESLGLVAVKRHLLATSTVKQVAKGHDQLATAPDLFAQRKCALESAEIPICDHRHGRAALVIDVAAQFLAQRQLRLHRCQIAIAVGCVDGIGGNRLTGLGMGQFGTDKIRQQPHHVWASVVRVLVIAQFVLQILKPGARQGGRLKLAFIGVFHQLVAAPVQISTVAPAIRFELAAQLRIVRLGLAG